MKTVDWGVNRVYCKKCGAELADDANYCSVCGASVKDVRREEFTVSSDDLVKTVKRLLDEANVRRIIIKDQKGKISDINSLFYL